MTTLYLDSNAFVKLFTDENLGEAAQVEAALEKSSDLASSAITYAEVCGVFARQLQQGRMSEEVYWTTRQAFEDNWEQVNVVEVSATVSKIAADVLKAQQGLRAMDALHLASGLALRGSTEIKFLTFDVRLQDAAGKLMPEQHNE
ncbi:PIN domain-containing protein [Deinococcus metallilatus]|uniref:Ribonuclease VapC n=1 Tax=Deinococcus metallilatus TaxID=1211322 RepID=A0AAJ5JZ87_9DEIO|nr:type II toxin-antitoxin system VapC family toxin [Deinococcus metallilatus]MBB5294537.1 putative nucleic acid-binding protein [Deinococcus metallilatus]QBY07583.1 PIN domain-containing protein [Deinococcus metallilatus]RXJ13999.1 PIN domain-containing protein [Deinococcus metallilatus]TLK29964.1 type II toxin-antitoxin system VapC family toxin [Deinococcus metallilatus]GMA15751.1 ribonuclease VapC [Deinococcus metallilatus]